MLLVQCFHSLFLNYCFLSNDKSRMWIFDNIFLFPHKQSNHIASNSKKDHRSTFSQVLLTSKSSPGSQRGLLSLSDPINRKKHRIMIPTQNAIFLEALASLGMVMSVTESDSLSVCLSHFCFFGKEITVAPVFLVI